MQSRILKSNCILYNIVLILLLHLNIDTFKIENNETNINLLKGDEKRNKN